MSRFVALNMGLSDRRYAVMTNSSMGSDDIARHLLNEAFPIAPPSARMQH